MQGTFLPESLSRELNDLLEHKQLVTATQTIKTSYSELRRYRYTWQPCSAAMLCRITVAIAKGEDA